MLSTSGQGLRLQQEYTAGKTVQPSPGREWILSIMQRANEITAEADTSCLVQGMLDLWIEITQADSAYFYQLDPAGAELVITHVRGDAESQNLVGLRLNRQQGFPGMTFGDTKILVIGDLPADPNLLHAVDPVNAAHKRNVINLPITNKQHTIGFVQIFNYLQAEVDLLLVLSERLAVEIDQRKDLASTRQSNQRLLTLVNMLGEVAGTLDRNRLLHLVTENASRLVDAERSSIFLVDPDTSDMIFQMSYQVPEQDPVAAADRNVGNPAKYHEPNRPVRDHSGSRFNLTNFQTGEFSYFNRSAITVPLRSAPLTGDRTDDHKHLFGGLMVLNKQYAVFQEEDAQLMQILANQASTFLQVAEMYEGAGDLFLGVIKALVTAIDAKDPCTQGHSQRVSDYSVLIAQELGFDEAVVNDIRFGSLLHDIGKIGIPDSILLKNDRLTGEEYAFVKQHPQTGLNILRQVKLLAPMTPAISEHHERLDGSGYPAQLIGKQISWMGRIVAVADVFDAMTSDRPYRLALSGLEVLAYLYEKAGRLFDVECVRALEHVVARSACAGLKNCSPVSDR